MTVKFLQRSIWQRIFGISATDKPQDESGWQYDSGQLTISLDRIPELTRQGTAVRFEGKSLPVRVLVVFGEDKRYQVFSEPVHPLWTPPAGLCSGHRNRPVLQREQVHLHV